MKVRKLRLKSIFWNHVTDGIEARAETFPLQTVRESSSTFVAFVMHLRIWKSALSVRLGENLMGAAAPRCPLQVRRRRASFRPQIEGDMVCKHNEIRLARISDVYKS